MEYIAPADVSLPSTPDREEQIPSSSIFSIFPPAKSLSSSSGDASLYNQTLIRHLSSSIPSFFPPDNSCSSSVSAQTKHISPYSITSLFPPTQSKTNSASSERPAYQFGHSIPSIFRPNYSYPSSVEPTHHYQLSETKEYHLQWSNIKDWRSIKFSINDEEEKIFPLQVEAAFNQARHERWTYAIYWESDGLSNSSLGHTLSPVKGFYNMDDFKFKDKAVSFFQLRELWPDNLTFGSVLCQVFSSSIPIWRAGADRLASSMYYRPRQGHEYGLQTMSWIRLADGVMEFGSTELIHRA
nr:transcription factor myc4 [Quercus suber]